MRKIKFLLPLIFLLSCSPQEDKPQYIDGDDLIPPEPSFVAYFTVHGEDVDQDGVRDDYELYVNKRFKDPNIRRAAKYEARVFGKFMKATNVFELNKLHLESIDSSVCWTTLSRGEIDPKTNDVLEINYKLLNNPWRRMHYNKLGEMVESKVYHWGNTSIMASLKRCKVKFSDLHKTLQVYVPNGRYKGGMTPEEIKEFETLMGIQDEK